MITPINSYITPSPPGTSPVPAGAVTIASSTNPTSSNPYYVQQPSTTNILTNRDFASALKSTLPHNYSLQSADGIDNRLYVQGNDATSRDDYQPRDSSNHSNTTRTMHSKPDETKHETHEEKSETANEHKTEAPEKSSETKDNGVVFDNGTDNAGIVGMYEGSKNNWHALRVKENAINHELYNIDPYTAYHSGIDPNKLLSFNDDEDGETYQTMAEQIAPQHLKITKEQGREYSKKIEQAINEGKMPAKQGLEEMRRILGEVNYTINEEATALNNAVAAL